MPADQSKPPESPLRGILAAYRATSQSEREKGTYFEELIRTYFRNEPKYADLYSDIWLYADWANEIGAAQFGFNAKDKGKVVTGFETADRGKLIIACGTGKTFTSLPAAS
jgi:predicted helicase